MSNKNWLRHQVAAFVLAAIFTTSVPIQTQAVEKPHEDSTIVLACLAVIIGGVFVYGVYKLCQKIPTTEPPPPPATNNPPVNINWTNRFGTNWHGLYPPPNWRPGMPLKLDLHQTSVVGSNPVEYHRYDFPKPIPFNVSAWNTQWWTTNLPYATTGYFNGAWSFKIESTTDLHLPIWTTKFQFVVYEADGDKVDPSTGEKTIVATLLNCYKGDYDASTNSAPIYSAFYSSSDYDGAPLPANFLPVADDATGDDLVNLTDPVRPQEFFRAVGVK